jgi:hypothetical protein
MIFNANKHVIAQKCPDVNLVRIIDRVDTGFCFVLAARDNNLKNMATFA